MNDTKDNSFTNSIHNFSLSTDFPETFFFDLLITEEKVKATPNKENISNLILMYKETIEHYEKLNNHPFQKEFLNRIQDLIVTKQYQKSFNPKAASSKSLILCENKENSFKNLTKTEENTEENDCFKQENSVKSQKDLLKESIIEENKLKEKHKNLNLSFKSGLDLVNNNIKSQTEELKKRIDSRKNKVKSPKLTSQMKKTSNKLLINYINDNTNREEKSIFIEKSISNMNFPSNTENESKKLDLDEFFTEFIREFNRKLKEELWTSTDLIIDVFNKEIDGKISKFREIEEAKYEFQGLLESSGDDYKASLEQMIESLDVDMRKYILDENNSIYIKLKESLEKRPYNLDYIVNKVLP